MYPVCFKKISRSDSILRHSTFCGSLFYFRVVSYENRGIGVEYGWLRGSQFSLEDLGHGLPPFTEKDALNFIRKAVEKGPQLLEWKSKIKTGQTLWTEIALKSSEGGGQSKVIAVLRDVTDRKQVEGKKTT